MARGCHVHMDDLLQVGYQLHDNNTAHQHPEKFEELAISTSVSVSALPTRLEQGKTVGLLPSPLEEQPCRCVRTLADIWPLLTTGNLCSRSETRSADEAKLTHAVREAHDAAAKAIRAEAASKATSNLISIISHVSSLSP